MAGGKYGGLADDGGGAAVKKAAYLLFCSFLTIYLAVMAALLLQLGETFYASRQRAGVSGAAFCRRGGAVELCDMNMPYGAFPAVKGPDTLRVFVIGSSQAMGSPYVHQRYNQISRFFPNQGGISTWLEDYLSAALPGKKIEVINAAKGNGQPMPEHFATFLEALAFSPDLVVFLAGNNEARSFESETDAAARNARIARRYAGYLARIKAAAAAAGTPVCLLTVPVNLRDWEPGGGAAAALFRRARSLDAAGDLAGARELYSRARDLDPVPLRAVSGVNEAIRKAGGATVRVLDAERIMFRIAPGGIPGSGLFHDYCHLTLAGNKLLAYEIAAFYLRSKGFSADALESLRAAPLRDLGRGSLRALYWLQRVKWLEYRLLPRRLQELGSNPAGLVNGYKNALEELDEINRQIYRFSADNGGRGGGEAARRPVERAVRPEAAASPGELLGRCRKLSGGGRLEDALRACQAAIYAEGAEGGGADPVSCYAYYESYKLLGALGRREEAQHALKWAVRSAPPGWAGLAAAEAELAKK